METVEPGLVWSLFNASNLFAEIVECVKLVGNVVAFAYQHAVHLGRSQYGTPFKQMGRSGSHFHVLDGLIFVSNQRGNDLT